MYLKNFEIEIDGQDLKIIWKMKLRRTKGFWRASLVGLPIAVMSEFKGQTLYDLKEKTIAFFDRLIGQEMQKLGFES